MVPTLLCEIIMFLITKYVFGLFVIYGVEFKSESSPTDPEITLKHALPYNFHKI